MTNTFLVSETKLREYTDLNNSVDSALIKNALREAQDITLQRTLGTNLYQKILDLVDTGDITSPSYSAYKTLLDDYIQDVVIYAAYWYTLDPVYLRPRNNGLLKPSGGENSEPIDKDLYNMKRQTVQNKLEFYNDKLTRYLIENEVTFPELNNNNFLYEQQPAYDTKYGSPFVFNRNDKTAEEFIKRGYRVYDSSRKQYPQ